jgi:hypothetical protein
MDSTEIWGRIAVINDTLSGYRVDGKLAPKEADLQWVLGLLEMKRLLLQHVR